MRASPKFICPRHLIWLFVAAILPVSVVSAQDLDGIIIRKQMSLRYEQSATSLPSQFSALGDREVHVRPGDSLSGLIGREYGVFSSTAPTAYNIFEREIMSRNSVADSDAVRAGTALVIPDAPRKALTRPSVANPLNRIPKIVVDPRISSNTALSPDELVGEPAKPLDVSDLGRAGASEAVIYRLVSKAEAEQSVAASDVTVESAPLTVTFAQDQSAANSGWLDPAIAQFIQQRLTGSQQQKPVLLIFDDSWPDDAQFRLSRDFFARALGDVRTHFRIPTQRFSASLVSATTAPWLVPAPPIMHSSEIRDALAPLESLAPPDGRVETIYLPMFTHQEGADELLQQLVEVNQVIRTIHPPYYTYPPKDVIDAANAVARSVSKRLAQSGATTDVQLTDVAVVQAAMNFCSYFSEATGRPCFLSMSWTVPRLWFPPVFPTPFHGALIAAVGNEGATNQSIYGLERDFASRSLIPNADVLAVMNIDAQGNPACNSTVLGNEISGVYGVAFPGFVSSNVCGTSFSTPRVAWLIAARESTRPAPADYGRWRVSLFQDLTTRSAGTGYMRVRLDVQQFFSSPN